MPFVISRWSPDLVFVVFVTTESNLGQYPFTLDDAFFPATPRGRGSLIVYGWDCCLWGQKTTCKRGPIWRVLHAAHGVRDKTLRVWVRLLSMGPRVCIAERTISCQLWMSGSPDWYMWYCGIFVIIYLTLDIMALEIILLVFTDSSI